MKGLQRQAGPARSSPTHGSFPPALGERNAADATPRRRKARRKVGFRARAFRPGNLRGTAPGVGCARAPPHIVPRCGLPARSRPRQRPRGFDSEHRTPALWGASGHASPKCGDSRGLGAPIARYCCRAPGMDAARLAARRVDAHPRALLCRRLPRHRCGSFLRFGSELVEFHHCGPPVSLA